MSAMEWNEPATPTALETEEVPSDWLSTPWAGGILRCIADPAADLDPGAATGWPEWAPLEVALADPFIRSKLGRWLVGGQSDAPASVIAAGVKRRTRLALLPTPEAVCLIQMAGAWIGAPSLAGLIRASEIARARAILGDEAFAFTVHAPLLPRPSAELMAASGASETLSTPKALLECGAKLFGLAIGAIPETLSARLRLRRPAPIWSTVAAACRDDHAGEAAYRAMQRLAHNTSSTWSEWFS